MTLIYQQVPSPFALRPSPFALLSSPFKTQHSTNPPKLSTPLYMLSLSYQWILEQQSNAMQEQEQGTRTEIGTGQGQGQGQG